MPCKKIRTEYMKRFREPQWSQFGQCYQELLTYRLSRRLLEQAHNPWLWLGEEAASDCSSDPRSPGQEVPCPTTQDIVEPDKGAAPTAPQCSAEVPSSSAALSVNKAKVPSEGSSQQTEVKENEIKTSHSREPHRQRTMSRQDGRKLARSPERRESLKEMRHPFALYASGEKRKDTGSQKTHNVCAPAPANEIHDSALRAKNRRQKEKRKQLLQKQRAHTVEAERNLIRKSSPPENPWLTEYMRCYSARAR